MKACLPELLKLLDIPGVAGIKMSDWNIFLLRSVVLEYPEKVVYSGFDEMLVPGLLYGADGCIGTWANLLPDLYAKVYARVRAGGADAVKPVMDEFTAFLAVGWNYGIIDTFEELMRARGGASAGPAHGSRARWSRPYWPTCWRGCKGWRIWRRRYEPRKGATLCSIRRFPAQTCRQAGYAWAP